MQMLAHHKPHSHPSAPRSLDRDTQGSHDELFWARIFVSYLYQTRSHKNVITVGEESYLYPSRPHRLRPRRCQHRLRYRCQVPSQITLHSYTWLSGPSAPHLLKISNLSFKKPISPFALSKLKLVAKKTLQKNRHQISKVNFRSKLFFIGSHVIFNNKKK